MPFFFEKAMFMKNYYKKSSFALILITQTIMSMHYSPSTSLDSCSSYSSTSESSSEWEQFTFSKSHEQDNQSMQRATIPSSFKMGHLDTIILLNHIKHSGKTQISEYLKKIPDNTFILYTDNPTPADYTMMYLNANAYYLVIKSSIEINQSQPTAMNTNLLDKIKHYGKQQKKFLPKKTKSIEIHNMQLDNCTTMSTTLNENYIPIKPLECITTFYDKEELENILAHSIT